MSETIFTKKGHMQITEFAKTLVIPGYEVDPELQKIIDEANALTD